MNYAIVNATERPRFAGIPTFKVREQWGPIGPMGKMKVAVCDTDTDVHVSSIGSGMLTYCCEWPCLSLSCPLRGGRLRSD